MNCYTKSRDKCPFNTSNSSFSIYHSSISPPKNAAIKTNKQTNKQTNKKTCETPTVTQMSDVRNETPATCEGEAPAAVFQPK